jgi:predicted nucleotidyltransferase
MLSEIKLDMEDIKRFCQKWKIQEFALFGSVLREDFKPTSDIDVLVKFEENHGWSLFDHMHMQDELTLLFQRPVDLVSKRAVLDSVNKFRKREIIGSAKVIYAAA